MNKKKGGGKGGGKVAPIAKGRNRGSRPTLDVSYLLETADLEVPEKLLGKVTPKALSSLAYQKKLLAVFAPVLLPAFLNGLHRNLRIADDKAQRLVADIFGMLTKSGGVSVQVNQQVASVGGRAADDDGKIGSFEDIVRILQTRRKTANGELAAGEPMTISPVFEATPEA